MTEGTEVEVLTDTQLAERARIDLVPLARKFMTDVASASDMDPRQAELAIINAIMSGTTVEDIFGDLGSLLQMKDYENRRITIHGYRFQQSDFDSFPVYMVLDITDEGSDEHAFMACGAKVCMAQVFVSAEHALLPVDVFVKKAPKATKGGFYPFRFLNAPVEEAF